MENGMSASAAAATEAEMNSYKSKRGPRAMLSIREGFLLMKLIDSEYATSRLGDTAFAKHATDKLGFAVLSSHIQTRRKELGIPSNSTFSDPPTLIKRIETLEQQVRILQAQYKQFVD